MACSLLCLLLPLLARVSAQTPRLRLQQKDYPVQSFGEAENYPVFFHDEGSSQVFIGGRNGLRILSFTDSGVSESKISIAADEKTKKDCRIKYPSSKAECENFIRVIQRLNRTTTILCGTHAGSPKCWFLTNEGRLQPGGPIKGENMAPALPSEPSVTLSVDGNLYAALSQEKSIIQRSYGPMKMVKTEEKWLPKTEFVSAALLPAKFRETDVIYFFFNEVNKTAGLDSEPFKAWMGRVCKVDEGGKIVLIDSWTTFLKARLVCGNATDPRRFDQLVDAYVLSEGSENGGTMYGIFANEWGSAAVCRYSMGRVTQAFASPKLKGYTGSLSPHVPGKCLSNAATSGLTKPVLTTMKDYPELDAAIFPDEQQPLYSLPAGDTYTQVIADRVWDTNNNSHVVLFLGTDKGKIHKVLQSGSQTLILAELNPFKDESPVSNLNLDTTTGHLYVGTATEATRLPLANCAQYGETCWECVLARDPYCGWDPVSKKCSLLSKAVNDSASSMLQSLDAKTVTACEDAQVVRSAEEDVREVSVTASSYIYLPCPVRSHHASYSWSKDNAKIYACALDDEACVLRFGEDTPMEPGLFTCSATEEGVKEEIMRYRLLQGGAAGVPQLAFWPAVILQLISISIAFY